MGTDFHEYPAACLRHGNDGIIEANRLADVVPPVGGVQLIAGQFGARDRREEPSRTIFRSQSIQALPHPTLDGFHGLAVERMVQIQHAEECSPGFQCRTQSFQGGQGARQRDVTGTVDAGHLHAGFQTSLPDDLPDLYLGQAHGRHTATALGQRLGGAAGADHPYRLIQRQGPHRPGGRHFADAMARGMADSQAHAPERFRHRHLDGEQARLGHLGTRQPGFSLGGFQFGQDGKSRLAPDAIVQVRDTGGEGRRFGQQPTPHAPPLGTVAGKDEGGLPRLGQDIQLHQPSRGLAPGIGIQARDDLVRVNAMHGQPMLQPLPAVGGAMGDIVVAR